MLFLAKLSYLDKGLLASNALLQLNYYHLNETMSKHSSLDLKLPNQLSLEASHYQKLTLIAFGITPVVIIFVFIKILIYINKKLPNGIYL